MAISRSRSRPTRAARAWCVAVSAVVVSVVSARGEVPLTHGQVARLVGGTARRPGTATVRFRARPPFPRLVDPRCPAGSAVHLRTPGAEGTPALLDCRRWRPVRHGYRYAGPVGAAFGTVTYRRRALTVRIRTPLVTTRPPAWLEVRLVVDVTSYCGRFRRF